MVLARHAAVAIENSQFYEDVRKARDQLQAWNRDLEAVVAERTLEIEQMNRGITARVLQAQEEERGRIARELHDETAQALAKLLIDVDVLKLQNRKNEPLRVGLDRLEHGLTRALDEVRGLSHDLRPAILEDFGLVAAIQSYAEDWMQTFGVPVWGEAQPELEHRLPSDVEIALSRIAQEAMMNAGKYAGAREVQIALSFAGDAIRLVVQDDGAGFELEELSGPSRQGGLGLYGMRERAALLGGSLTIESGVGRGTRVSLVMPAP